MRFRNVVLCAVVVVALLGSLTSHAAAVAIRTNAGFNSNTLAPNDDFYTGLVPVGFSGDFFGLNFSAVYVNNNGNVTFTGPLGTYTPFNLITTGMPMIAPFFADVDTRYAGEPVRYGQDTVDGRSAFGVNWIDVDYFFGSASHTSRNSFQLVMTDRSDIAPGDFDIEFNYDQIQWETGEASGGDPDGLGGSSARVGWSNGLDAAFELPGSAVNGAFLDNGPAATVLIHNSLSSDVSGRYVFQVRDGQVEPPDPNGAAVPEPATAALSLLGLGALLAASRRRRRA